LIIGGETVGASIALDAASRGLKTALIERGDYGSSRARCSASVSYNGLHHLEHVVRNLKYDGFKDLREIFRDRGNLLYSAPHLSESISVLIPVNSWWQVPYFWAGTKLLDSIAGPIQGKSVYFLNKSRVLGDFPMIDASESFGAFVRNGQIVNQIRLDVSLALTASLYGATIVNHIDVLHVDKEDDHGLFAVRVRDGLRNENRQASEEFVIRAKCIIDASRSGIDRGADGTESFELAERAINFVIPGYYTTLNPALVDEIATTSSIICLRPWYGRTLATFTAGSLAGRDLRIAKESVEALIRKADGQDAETARIHSHDISAAWSDPTLAGHSPDVPGNGQDQQDNIIPAIVRPDLISVSAGRYTTGYRAAKEAVDKAIETFGLETRALSGISSAGDVADSHEGEVFDGRSQLDKIRLIGAQGYSGTLFIHLIRHHSLEEDIARHLAATYGDLSWAIAALGQPTRLSTSCPFVEGEVRYVLRHEDVHTMVDLISRRVPLALTDVDDAVAALPRLLEIMSQELGWTAGRKAQEAKAAISFLSSIDAMCRIEGSVRA
jgi:glycerol-3-phosphate dehydrogenase